MEIAENLKEEIILIGGCWAWERVLAVKEKLDIKDRFFIEILWRGCNYLQLDLALAFLEELTTRDEHHTVSVDDLLEFKRILSKETGVYR